VSLEEMNAVRLMNRIDTKYTTSIDLLPAILLSLQKDIDSGNYVPAEHAL
jgi:hypothetical protein